MLYTEKLPTQLFTAEQVKAIDAAAIAQLNCAGFDLMQTAAQAAWQLFKQRYPQAQRVVVFCGKGNNAGDGLVFAALAKQAWIDVTVLLLEPVASFSDTAQQAYEYASQNGVECISVDSVDVIQYLQSADVVIDAILGIGLSGEVKSAYKTCIEQINASNKSVLAMDIPSGLCANTGVVLGSAINAELTISFIALKQGLLMHEGLAWCGELFFADLNVPPAVFAEFVPSLNAQQAVKKHVMPARTATAYKSNFSHVLVVGGDYGMGGAAILTAEAAARTGAGLVTLATRTEHVAPMLARCPSVMAHGVDTAAQLKPLIEAADYIVVGPGMAESAWVEQMFNACLDAQKPMVIDAGALNLLAQNTCFMNKLNALPSAVYLPHPGEAACLLNTTAAHIQQDRVQALHNLDVKLPGVVLLKGAGTLMAEQGQKLLCARANQALATAGMGDVLAGIVAGVLAQANNSEASFLEKVNFAVTLHLDAAEFCEKQQALESVLPSDVVKSIGSVL